MTSPAPPSTGALARRTGCTVPSIRSLQELEASLAGFVDSCNTACAGGPALDCSILEDLSLSLPASGPGSRATGCRGG